MERSKSSRQHVVVAMQHCNGASELSVLHRRHSKVLQQHSMFGTEEGMIPFADAVFGRDEVVVLEKPSVFQIDDDVSSRKHSRLSPRPAVFQTERALLSTKRCRSLRDEAKSHRNQKEFLSNPLCFMKRPSLSLRDQGVVAIEHSASRRKPRVIHGHCENTPSFHRVSRAAQGADRPDGVRHRRGGDREASPPSRSGRRCARALT